MYDKCILVKNLKQFRKDRNLKQKDVYEAMGCSQAAYSNYENENSKRLPSVENLINLSEAFGISIDDILGTNIQTRKTAADIINLLCDIFDIVPFRIGKAEFPVDTNYHNIPDPNNTRAGCLPTMDRHAIYFDSRNYEKALSEMYSILSLRTNWEMMDRMLAVWKEGARKEYGHVPACDACSDDM